VKEFMSLGLTEHNGQEVVNFINIIIIIIIIIIFGPPAQSRRYEQKQRPRRVSLVSLSLKTSYRIVTKTTRRRCDAVVAPLWRLSGAVTNVMTYMTCIMQRHR